MSWTEVFLMQWAQYDKQRQSLMAQELKRLLAAPGLSDNVFEVADKSVQQ